MRAYSSAWLERFPDKEEVRGSSPLRPTLTIKSFEANPLKKLLLVVLAAAGAEELAIESLQIATDSGQPDAMAIVGAHLLATRWQQGRIDEVID